MTSRPAAGPWDPLPITPALVPDSARRTTSLDVVTAAHERTRVDLRGQDLVVDGDGAVRVVARCELVLDIDPVTWEISGIDGGGRPDGRDGLDELVGANVRTGFGRRLASVLAEEADARSLRYSILEDLGGAALVSGYAGLRQGTIHIDAEVAPAMAEAQADICAGWAAGGPLHRCLVVDGHVPVPYGPAAPPIEAADPRAWHPLPPLAPGTVRRRRQLDVVGRHRVRSHFRDSYAGTDEEMVMHEYSVDAALDGRTRLTAVDVAARVLPWRECPGAAGSARALVGVAAADLPGRVRAELVGPSTCTHLNSTMRALADVLALLG